MTADGRVIGVVSLTEKRRCRDLCEALLGPLHHPTGKPVWKVYDNAERNGRCREDRELRLHSWFKPPVVPIPGQDECVI